MPKPNRKVLRDKAFTAFDDMNSLTYNACLRLKEEGPKGERKDEARFLQATLSFLDREIKKVQEVIADLNQ